MTGLLDKIRDKISSSGSQEKNQPKESSGNMISSTSQKSSEGEQVYSTLPHDAKTNNPADLQQPGSEEQSFQPPDLNAEQAAAINALKSNPGPVISEEVGKQPVTDSADLKAKAAELNKDDSNTNQESSGPVFSILPHPAKTNNPADLIQDGSFVPPDLNAEQAAAINALRANPGPVISEEVGKQPVLDSAQVDAKAKELNK
ncbi:uncharacterized protein FOMMEDRAFT_131229 [Fomitiporia mediterranea MF3/22]|uniref:uncharacterized protein n=1 Tax=Fomitiporia mediterranea (strain MF3/22) TaxID=694068 RepID=UPI00044088A4|nr:uncharacterized protein FOMMEDRAFT_131229 [Fomitiporia mediterranea MF3/22]EJD08487.1 hypothetical protein FOMMEDRAFT_131229 [Fomitiporia mediterranea MF3/22]